MHLSIHFFYERAVCEFFSGLVHFLSFSHSSSSFKCVSAIVSMLVILLECSL